MALTRQRQAVDGNNFAPFHYLWRRTARILTTFNRISDASYRFSFKKNIR